MAKLSLKSVLTMMSLAQLISRDNPYYDPYTIRSSSVSPDQARNMWTLFLKLSRCSSFFTTHCVNYILQGESFQIHYIFVDAFIFWRLSEMMRFLFDVEMMPQKYESWCILNSSIG